MADATMGHATRISMGAAGTTVGSFSEAYEFISESVQKRQVILNTEGISGTRSRKIERARNGTYAVAGTIRLHATPAMLDLLLPRILGANESNDVFAVADTLPEFAILMDKGPQRHLYDGCKVNRAVFASAAGGLLTVDLDIVGKTEEVSATSFPSISAPTDSPYVHQDAVLTISSTARKMMDVTWTVDNAVVARFTNSIAATDVSPTDRRVTFGATLPYESDHYAIYDQNIGSAAAAALVYTNGNLDLTVDFGRLVLPGITPTIDSKGEVVLRLEGEAMMVSSTREVVFTNDSST